MELSRLSGYDRYILITQQTRGMRSNMQAYGVFKETIAFIEKCSKTDAKIIHYNNKYYDKPVTRSQAQNVLDKVAKAKWDPLILSVAKFLDLDIRV